MTKCKHEETYYDGVRQGKVCDKIQPQFRQDPKQEHIPVDGILFCTDCNIQYPAPKNIPDFYQPRCTACITKLLNKFNLNKTPE